MNALLRPLYLPHWCGDYKRPLYLPHWCGDYKGLTAQQKWFLFEDREIKAENREKIGKRWIARGYIFLGGKG